MKLPNQTHPQINTIKLQSAINQQYTQATPNNRQLACLQTNQRKQQPSKLNTPKQTLNLHRNQNHNQTGTPKHKVSTNKQTLPTTNQQHNKPNTKYKRPSNNHQN